MPNYFMSEYEKEQEALSKCVTIVGNVAKDITFHDAATIATCGTIFVVNGFKILTIEIYGTSTTRTVSFEGIGASGIARQIMGVRLSDFATAITTTGTGEYWQFDVSGLVSFQANLTAVAGGNVSIKGRVVV